MAKSVDEINMWGYTLTGKKSDIDQAEFTLEITYTKDDGEKVKVKAKKYIFPDDLKNVPPDVYKRWVEEWMIAYARVENGIDTWENYR